MSKLLFTPLDGKLEERSYEYLVGDVFVFDGLNSNGNCTKGCQMIAVTVMMVNFDTAFAYRLPMICKSVTSNGVIKMQYTPNRDSIGKVLLQKDDIVAFLIKEINNFEPVLILGGTVYLRSLPYQL